MSADEQPRASRSELESALQHAMLAGADRHALRSLFGRDRVPDSPDRTSALLDAWQAERALWRSVAHAAAEADPEQARRVLRQHGLR